MLRLAAFAILLLLNLGASGGALAQGAGVSTLQAIRDELQSQKRTLQAQLKDLNDKCARTPGTCDKAKIGKLQVKIDLAGKAEESLRGAAEELAKAKQAGPR
jgi:hypothetical protein